MKIILNPVTFANTLHRGTSNIMFQAIWERKARKVYFWILFLISVIPVVHVFIIIKVLDIWKSSTCAGKPSVFWKCMMKMTQQRTKILTLK